jgi:transcriptional regulator with XRE-family HTH domain
VPKRNWDAQLASFLRKQRGEMSYSQFALKVGIGHMTARRLESGEHHITLKKLEGILDRLKLKLSDVFPDEYNQDSAQKRIKENGLDLGLEEMKGENTSELSRHNLVLVGDT